MKFLSPDPFDAEAAIIRIEQGLNAASAWCDFVGRRASWDHNHPPDHLECR